MRNFQSRAVYSEAKAMTEDKILSSQQAKFEAALSTLNEGLQTQGRLKNYDKVQRKIGRLIQQYARVGSQYHIEVNASKTHPHNAANLVWKRNKQAMEKDRTKGAYLLRTSQSQWSDERCLRTYWLLNEVEQTFRSLKTELGLRPIHHQLASRIKSHLFISVLAYHACAYPSNALKAIRHSSPMGRHSTAHEFNDAPTNDSQKPSQINATSFNKIPNPIRCKSVSFTPLVCPLTDIKPLKLTQLTKVEPNASF